MANFITAHGLTMGHEGGYANNSKDKGGETYKGVSRNNWPAWAGWPIIDSVTRNVPRADFDAVLGKNATLQGLVLGFYKTNFWDVLKLDAVTSQAVANELFDTSVNMGQKVAARFVQEAILLTTKAALTVDGQIGTATLALINAYPRPVLLVRVLNGLQAERYLKILRDDPTQEDFANSWFSRTLAA